MNNKTRDNLLYLGIALGVAAVILGPLVYAISRGRDIPHFPVKPAWLVISTVVLVAYVIQNLRRRRFGIRRALPLLLVVALAHVVISLTILDRVTRLPILLLGIGIFLEAHAALLIIQKLGVRLDESKTN
jgi:hypothetical protein